MEVALVDQPAGKLKLIQVEVVRYLGLKQLYKLSNI